jgi:hypothetical protein
MPKSAARQSDVDESGGHGVLIKHKKDGFFHSGAAEQGVQLVANQKST